MPWYSIIIVNIITLLNTAWLTLGQEMPSGNNLPTFNFFHALIQHYAIAWCVCNYANVILILYLQYMYNTKRFKDSNSTTVNMNIIRNITIVLAPPYFATG